MPRAKKFGTDFGIPLAVAAFLYAVAGSSGLVLAAILSLPWFAWRFDNRSGTFLPLAVMILVVCGVLSAMLALMAVVFSR